LKSTDDDLLEIIISFRQYVRMRETKNIQQVIRKHNESQSSTFATDHSRSTFNEQSFQESENVERKNFEVENAEKEKKKRSCVCENFYR
jgi:hypothetical protein